MLNKYNFYHIFYHLSRFILGITFVFSGFVKGQDPLGTAFKLEDYFIAFGWDWAMPFALVLSISLCTFEFGLGAALLLNLQIHLASWLTLLTMLFFTGLTLHDALTNPVPDCGCFGDAIKLTNWQTFYKNLFLLFFVFLMFYSAKVIQVQKTRRTTGFVIVFMLFATFSLWSYYHLPVIDFLPFKVGTHFNSNHKEPAQYFLTYKNKLTGEEKEMLASEIPYTDSNWMAQWEYIRTRVYNPGGSQRPDIQMIDSVGNDVSTQYLLNPDFQFIATIYDLETASEETLKNLFAMLSKAEAEGHSVIVLCPATAEEIEELKLKFGVNFEIFGADDIILKMMVRANPGLLLLKEGKILAKWNARTLPKYEVINQKFLL